MTTENSVRELAKRLREGGWDLRTPQELADMIASWLDNIAAPAPAGSRKSREELLADLESARQRAIDAGIEFQTPEEIRAEVERNRSATPQPEQGAGLAEDDTLATDYLLLDGKMHKLDDIRAALARQQSRVVDEDAQDAIDSILKQLEDWSRAYPTDIFHEPTQEERDWLHATKPGLMDCIAASMGRHMAGCIAADLAALRAALEGDRDG